MASLDYKDVVWGDSSLHDAVSNHPDTVRLLAVTIGPGLKVGAVAIRHPGGRWDLKRTGDVADALVAFIGHHGVHNIQYMAVGPGRQYYVTTTTGPAEWYSLSAEFQAAVGFEHPVYVSFGAGGSFYVRYADGRSRWSSGAGPRRRMPECDWACLGSDVFDDWVVCNGGEWEVASRAFRRSGLEESLPAQLLAVAIRGDSYVALTTAPAPSSSSDDEGIASALSYDGVVWDDASLVEYLQDEPEHCRITAFAIDRTSSAAAVACAVVITDVGPEHLRTRACGPVAPALLRFIESVGADHVTFVAIGPDREFVAASDTGKMASFVPGASMDKLYDRYGPPTAASLGAARYFRFGDREVWFDQARDLHAMADGFLHWWVCLDGANRNAYALVREGSDCPITRSRAFRAAGVEPGWTVRGAALSGSAHIVFASSAPYAPPSGSDADSDDEVCGAVPCVPEPGPSAPAAAFTSAFTSAFPAVATPTTAFTATFPVVAAEAASPSGFSASPTTAPPPAAVAAPGAFPAPLCGFAAAPAAAASPFAIPAPVAPFAFPAAAPAGFPLPAVASTAAPQHIRRTAAGRHALHARRRYGAAFPSAAAVAPTPFNSVAPFSSAVAEAPVAPVAPFSSAVAEAPVAPVAPFSSAVAEAPALAPPRRSHGDWNLPIPAAACGRLRAQGPGDAKAESPRTSAPPTATLVTAAENTDSAPRFESAFPAPPPTVRRRSGPLDAAQRRIIVGGHYLEAWSYKTRPCQRQPTCDPTACCPYAHSASELRCVAYARDGCCTDPACELRHVALPDVSMAAPDDSELGFGNPASSGCRPGRTVLFRKRLDQLETPPALKVEMARTKDEAAAVAFSFIGHAFLRQQGENGFLDPVKWVLALEAVERTQVESDMLRFDRPAVTFARYEEAPGESAPLRARLVVVPCPGLMERRPSVLVGDSIVAKGPDGCHRGYVFFLRRDELVVSFAPGAVAVDRCYAVRFEAPLRTFRLRATALRRAPLPLLTTALALEHIDSVCEWSAATHAACDGREGTRALNEQQLSFVRDHVFAPGRVALLHGPPGTGKTTTVVAAAAAAVLSGKKAKVLCCTPSNMSADLIVERLVPLLQAARRTAGDVIRVHGASRDLRALSAAVRARSGAPDRFPELSVLSEAAVIVTTVITAGTLWRAGLEPGAFTHILVDEAGQVTEGELAVPLLLAHPRRTKIVLAGDHKQLGPVLRSRVAEQAGMGTSPLERLMGSAGMAEAAVVLTANYRAHRDIVSLYNPAYGGVLTAEAPDQDRVTDTIGAYAVNFHHHSGLMEQEPESPSWVNRAEAVYVRGLVGLVIANGVPAADIAVLSPYAAQCKVLRAELRAAHTPPPVVCSVEQFQGREAPVVVLSTVRSVNVARDGQRTTLPADELTVGFLRQPRRLNVAISRPSGALFVVGDAHVLRVDPGWRALMHRIAATGVFRIATNGQNVLAGALAEFLAAGAEVEGCEDAEVPPRQAVEDAVSAVTAELGQGSAPRATSLSVERPWAGTDRLHQ